MHTHGSSGPRPLLQSPLLAAAGPDRCCCTPFSLPRQHCTTGHTRTPLRGWSNAISDSGRARIVFPSILKVKLECFYPGCPGSIPGKGRIFFFLPPARRGHLQLVPCREGRHRSPMAQLLVKHAAAAITCSKDLQGPLLLPN